jgi:hypothetical protein
MAVRRRWSRSRAHFPARPAALPADYPARPADSLVTSRLDPPRRPDYPARRADPPSCFRRVGPGSRVRVGVSGRVVAWGRRVGPGSCVGPACRAGKWRHGSGGRGGCSAGADWWCGWRVGPGSQRWGRRVGPGSCVGSACRAGVCQGCRGPGPESGPKLVRGGWGWLARGGVSGVTGPAKNRPPSARGRGGDPDDLGQRTAGRSPVDSGSRAAGLSGARGCSASSRAISSRKTNLR